MGESPYSDNPDRQKEGLSRRISFEGFTSTEQANYVETWMRVTGLPLDNIHTIRFIQGASYSERKTNWIVVGHYNPSKGEYALYKSWGRFA